MPHVGLCIGHFAAPLFGLSRSAAAVSDGVWTGEFWGTVELLRDEGDQLRHVPNMFYVGSERVIAGMWDSLKPASAAAHMSTSVTGAGAGTVCTVSSRSTGRRTAGRGSVAICVGGRDSYCNCPEAWHTREEGLWCQHRARMQTESAQEAREQGMGVASGHPPRMSKEWRVHAPWMGKAVEPGIA